MNKNEDVIKELEIEVKKPTTRTHKTTEKSTLDAKTKKTATAKKEKSSVAQITKTDIEKTLVKSIQSKKKLHIEYYGKQVSEQEIADKLFEHLKENEFSGTIKSLKIYFKVEENTAYCVINEDEPIILNF
jgi:hypothetical protein